MKRKAKFCVSGRDKCNDSFTALKLLWAPPGQTGLKPTVSPTERKRSRIRRIGSAGQDSPDFVHARLPGKLSPALPPCAETTDPTRQKSGLEITSESLLRTLSNGTGITKGGGAGRAQHTRGCTENGGSIPPPRALRAGTARHFPPAGPSARRSSACSRSVSKETVMYQFKRMKESQPPAEENMHLLSCGGLAGAQRRAGRRPRADR